MIPGDAMIHLTLLLCASLFVILLIGGRDHGQLRPGLAAAGRATEPPPQVMPAAAVSASAPATPAASTPVAVDMPLVLPLVRQPAPLAEAVVAGPEGGGEILYVDVRAVNVRSGPGTGHAIIGKLTRGEAALVLETGVSGWSRILIEGDGIEGYVSSGYLTPEPPADF